MSVPAIAWRRVVTARTVPLLLADVLMSARRIARHLGSCLNLFVCQCVLSKSSKSARPSQSHCRRVWPSVRRHSSGSIGCFQNVCRLTTDPANPAAEDGVRGSAS